MADKNYETVKIEREGGITFLMLNRPAQRNAMSPQLHFEMEDAMDNIAVDPQTEVMVLTGVGESFCAGQDLKLYFRGTENDPVTAYKAHQASDNWRWVKLSRFPKPTIAMVNGYCFGGGLTPMAACDFAIAADEAIFGVCEINWGIIPGGNVSWIVSQLMNYRDALRYSMTGEPFNGKRATELGCVNYSVPRSELRAETVKLARTLITKSPLALRYTKEAIRTVRFMNELEARDYIRAKSDACVYHDKDRSRDKGMHEFLDNKSFRPGLGEFDRKTAKPE